jgi:hypothetical protein
MDNAFLSLGEQFERSVMGGAVGDEKMPDRHNTCPAKERYFFQIRVTNFWLP